MTDQAKQAVVLAQPPRAVKDMTDAEIEDWAKQIHGRMTGNRKPVVKMKARRRKREAAEADKRNRKPEPT